MRIQAAAAAPHAAVTRAFACDAPRYGREERAVGDRVSRLHSRNVEIARRSRNAGHICRRHKRIGCAARRRARRVRRHSTIRFHRLVSKFNDENDGNVSERKFDKQLNNNKQKKTSVLQLSIFHRRDKCRANCRHQRRHNRKHDSAAWRMRATAAGSKLQSPFVCSLHTIGRTLL